MRATYNKNFNKLIILSFLSLVGCYSGRDLQGELEPNFVWDKNKQQGIAAVVVACDVGSEDSRLYFTPVNEKNDDKYYLNVPCNPEDDDLQKMAVKLLNVPAGEYKFTGWYQNYTDQILSVNNFKPITFRVLPNRATYIGRLGFVYEYDGKINIVIANKSNEDIPKIKQKAPILKGDKIDIDIAKFNS